MKIISPAFMPNKPIPKEYTCQGENTNPPLQFVDVPANAKSLVLIMDDPDAVSGTFDHWVVFNIDVHATAVLKRNIPHGGVEGLSSTGKPGYVGPCPPNGEHRYFFKLYALNSTLSLNPSVSSKADVEAAMKGRILAQAEIIGLYRKE